MSARSSAAVTLQRPTVYFWRLDITNSINMLMFYETASLTNTGPIYGSFIYHMQIKLILLLFFLLYVNHIPPQHITS